jgi:hypothetical protein
MASQFEEGSVQAEGVNPLAFIVPVVILAVVVAVVMGRRNTTALDKAGDSARRATRRGRNTPRRMAIGVLINALENDLARRALIMGLKIARNRM